MGTFAHKAALGAVFQGLAYSRESEQEKLDVAETGFGVWLFGSDGGLV